MLFFMEYRLMDLSILSDYTGFWKWQIRRHLKPDGVLAVHVSNRFLDVGPVVALQAAEDKKPALMFTYAGNEENDESASDWVIVTSRPGFFGRSEMARAGEIATAPHCDHRPARFSGEGLMRRAS